MNKTFPGIAIVKVYEGSRIRNTSSIFDSQMGYVKIKCNGRKARTLAISGGSAPRWNEEHENELRLEVDDIKVKISVEIWNENRRGKNFKIDAVLVPLEPYALTFGMATPRWHKLALEGSLLFSVGFEPDPSVEVVYSAVQKFRPKRAADPTAIDHAVRYHTDDAPDAVRYGDEICMHALGKRWVKYGSCMRTHLQRSKKCLQLTQNLDDYARFKICGDEDKRIISYGCRFQLDRMNAEDKVNVGTGLFQLLPVDPNEQKNGQPILYGDSCYLQAYYAKIGGQTLGAEGQSQHVFDPTIYISPHCPKVAFTLTYRDGLLKNPHMPPVGELQFKLTTYNVWMMPDKITLFANVSPKKCERAQLIPEALPDSDVVVFNEAFCHISRPILLEAMKEKGFYFESPVVGHLVGRIQAKFLDGGIVLVSRYPILETDIMLFGGVSHGDDSLADKGVVYACIAKEGRRVHVFASHTQAWTSAIAMKIRQAQFRMLRNFIDEKEIPANEPVIVAGDFNVNKLLDTQNHEYATMMDILECTEPNTENPQVFASFDATNNPLAKSGPSSDGIDERLDYILNCAHHLQPAEATVTILPIKAKAPWHWDKKAQDFKDLSDHYPVTSSFSFSYK